MPDRDDSNKSVDLLDDEAFRLELQELKARVAALHQRVDALERKKRDAGSDSTSGRH